MAFALVSVQLLSGGLLVALWLLAWGEITLANVVSGAAVDAALLVEFPARPRRSGTGFPY
jgi:hypothetical protein